MRRSSEDRLLNLARKQFKRCGTWENTFLNSYVNDIKFANGDPDNGWQWPDLMMQGRTSTALKPRLTVNQIRYFNNLIVNEIKKSPPGIIVRPERGGATVKSAEVYSNWIRNITRKSRFGDIIGRAARFQVDGGVAYWRVVTQFEDEMAMTQTARIVSVRDMSCVFIDPDAKEPDKSDAKFGFIFEDILKDDAHRQYPELAKAGMRSTSFLKDLQGWIAEDHYRMAEWFNLEEHKDEVVQMVIEDTGETVTQWLSKIPEELREEILSNPLTERRKGTRKQMRWYKIIGDRIVAERDWPGKYVPIVQVVGDEIVVEGKLDRKGNTRLLKDAQRMDNYWISAATEHVALQGKTPWLADIRALEGYETYWANANTQNPAYLPFKSFDSQGRPITPPQRQQPPEFSNAYLTGMQIATQKLALISGQRQGAEGQMQDPGQSDTQSGRAILAKKAMGETSNFNFRDNLAIGVTYTGKILLDILPRITDTERMVKAIAQDGEEQDININPGLGVPMEERNREGEENAKDIFFNPSFGTYDIDAEAGPDYPTQRQYAVEAMGTIVARNNQLWGVIGDLLVKNMDFPGAEEMAERIRRTIPKNILGEGATPEMEQLVAQNQQLTELLENFSSLLAAKNLELKNKDEETTIKAMDAETRRIKELGNAQENFKDAGLSEEVKALIVHTIGQAFETMLPESVRKTDEEQLTKMSNGSGRLQLPPGATPGGEALPAAQPRHPAGRISPKDGLEYVETSPGKFARVEEPEAPPQ